MTTIAEEKSKKPRRGQYQPGDEILDELLKKHGSTREGIFGAEGIVPMLTKRLVERALRGELTHHLGYEQREKASTEENCRNGYSKKTLLYSFR